MNIAVNSVCSSGRICFFFQTYLEQTKTKFNKGYLGMNLAKVTTTVGLNSMYSRSD